MNKHIFKFFVLFVSLIGVLILPFACGTKNTPTSPSNTETNTIGIGSRVMAGTSSEINQNTNPHNDITIDVRDITGNLQFSQIVGVHGTIAEAPTKISGFSGDWVKVNWDAGPPVSDGTTFLSPVTELSLVSSSEVSVNFIGNNNYTLNSLNHFALQRSSL